MANLTLTIDEHVLRRARIRALSEGTSVNAVVRDFLGGYAGERAAHPLTGFLEAARASRAGSGAGGRSWTRDDLYSDRLER